MLAARSIDSNQICFVLNLQSKRKSTSTPSQRTRQASFFKKAVAARSRNCSSRCFGASTYVRNLRKSPEIFAMNDSLLWRNGKAKERCTSLSCECYKSRSTVMQHNCCDNRIQNAADSKSTRSTMHEGMSTKRRHYTITQERTP